MNKATITTSKSNPLAHGHVQVIISPEIEDMFKSVFELEILQGKREIVIEDGVLMVSLDFHTDHIKATALQQWVTKMCMGIKDNNN